jgi:opacity protein-like surface antigen
MFTSILIKLKINFMKKSLFFFLFILFFNSLQAQIYPKGSVNFSAGYGVVTYGNIALKLLSSEVKNLKSTLTGPIYLKGEYAVADNFTIGLNINYSKTSGTFTLDSLNVIGKYSGTLGLSSTSAILRANYTIPFAEDKAGFMIGVGMGYRGFRSSYSDNKPETPLDGGISIPIPFTGELTLGLKYYFTENMGVYVETGITRSLFQGGITARF